MARHSAEERAAIARDLTYQSIVKEMTGGAQTVEEVTKKFHVYGWTTFQSVPEYLGDHTLRIMDEITVDPSRYVRIEYIECLPS